MVVVGLNNINLEQYLRVPSFQHHIEKSWQNLESQWPKLSEVACTKWFNYVITRLIRRNIIVALQGQPDLEKLRATMLLYGSKWFD